MSNPWVNHIKQFAQDKGITYACALTNPDCKASYVKISDKMKNNVATIASHLAKKVQDEDESRLPYLRLQFNKTSKNVKEYFKEHFKSEYKQLFPKN
jgi:hypothetical protein